MSIVLRLKNMRAGWHHHALDALKLDIDGTNQFDLTLRSNGFRSASYSLVSYRSPKYLLDLTFNIVIPVHDTPNHNLHAFHLGTVSNQCWTSKT